MKWTHFIYSVECQELYLIIEDNCLVYFEFEHAGFGILISVYTTILANVRSVNFGQKLPRGQTAMSQQRP